MEEFPQSSEFFLLQAGFLKPPSFPWVCLPWLLVGVHGVMEASLYSNVRLHTLG